MPFQPDIVVENQNSVVTNGLGTLDGYHAVSNESKNTNTNAAVTQSGNYRCHSVQLSIETQIDIPNFTDITEAVRRVVAESGIRMGTVTVYSKHTTASIVINENEPLLLIDMCQRLSKLFPPEDYYRHNDFSIRTHNMNPGESPNGHSHCQHLALSTSETIPVVEGQMDIGRWQSIFLVELDRPLKRTVSVMVSGI
ncbi:secondary thiamine-phosphate synthase enzyme YjbQ [Candidatus Chlorohelix sp.]|uniref:secondary thiamine-phosphate synthase enzyme YjbQ n=1 Tax=Candidatus Chlorohelix sp. TaxID=3139201 RepID=UPI0030718E42